MAVVYTTFNSLFGIRALEEYALYISKEAFNSLFGILKVLLGVGVRDLDDFQLPFRDSRRGTTARSASASFLSTPFSGFRVRNA